MFVRALTLHVVSVESQISCLLVISSTGSGMRRIPGTPPGWVGYGTIRDLTYPCSTIRHLAVLPRDIWKERRSNEDNSSYLDL